MAATTAGTKTVTKDVSPQLTAATLTTLLAIPIELLTVAQLQQITTAMKKVSGGHDPTQVIGTLLP